tara:strand:- start:4536 stop:5255 length:720 start_codon:yes stop_codon:yes gene_type:complete
MYGKKLKELNTKKALKRIKDSSWVLTKICSEHEYSYFKIQFKKNKIYSIKEKNFYIYVNSGGLIINKILFPHSSSFIFSKNKIYFKVKNKTSIYLFFFKESNLPKILHENKILKTKIKKLKIQKKKKYWGKILNLINNKNGAAKIIYMYKNTQSSMEYHINKKENYYLDYGLLDLGIRYSRGINGLIKLKKNNSFSMKPGTMHIRIAKENSKIVEMSNKDDDRDSIIVHDGKKYKFKVG